MKNHLSAVPELDGGEVSFMAAVSISNGNLNSGGKNN